MKIYMLDPSAFTFPYDNALCTALAKDGHDVTLFTRPERTSGEFSETVEYQIEKYFYFFSEAVLAYSFLRPLGRILKGAEHVVDMMRFIIKVAFDPPDIVHFQWTPLPIIDRLFVRILRKFSMVVLTVHDVKFLHGSASSPIQLRGWRRSMSEYSGLVVHTKSAREELESMGLPKGLVEIVPHGPLSLARANCEPPLEKKNSILLFGNIKQYKGVDILLKAWATLPTKTHEAWEMTVAGSGESLVEEYKTLADELGLKSHVKWISRYLTEEELSELLSEAKIAVFPYREIDASGAFEAAIPFRPAILATDVGVFSEALCHMNTGYLCKPDNVDSLARGLELLTSEPGLVDKLSFGLAEARKDFPSWTEISRLTCHLYETYGSRNSL